MMYGMPRNCVLKSFVLAEISHLSQRLRRPSRFSTTMSSSNRVKSDGIVYAILSSETDEDVAGIIYYPLFATLPLLFLLICVL